MIVSLILGTILWVVLTQLKNKDKPLISTDYRQYIIIGVIFLIVLPVLIGMGNMWGVKDIVQPFLSGLFLGEVISSGITNFMKRRHEKAEARKAKRKKSRSSSSSTRSGSSSSRPRETPEERGRRKRREADKDRTEVAANDDSDEALDLEELSNDEARKD